MINIDGSVIIQIVNFIFLIWILNILLYKPIRGILIKRREKILGFKKSIESSENEAEEKDRLYALGIKEARAKGLKAKEAIINEAAEEEARIIKEITDKAHADLEKVKGQINQEIDEVRQALMSQVDDFARAITQKILGRTI